MKTATMNLTTKEFSGEITNAAKSILLMIDNKYKGLLKCNKRFLDGAIASISYCGSDVPTIVNLEIDYKGTGEQYDYCNQILRMWAYDFCKPFLALPTRISVVQNSPNGINKLNSRFFKE